MMNLNRFVEQGQGRWQRLEQLVARANRNVWRFSEEELEEFGRLYRLTTSDLALAQRDFAGQRITRYLNQLVGQAHALIYRGQPLQWRRLRAFFTRGFPALYRQILPYTILSFALFLLPTLAAFLVVWRDPGAVFILLGPKVAHVVEMVEAGELWTDIAPNVRSLASSAIMTNNLQVMFLTFAGGVTAGLLTLYVLLINGLQFGAIFGLLQAHGLSAGLAEFVVGHGFIELSVIFLAGGCGLYMADGLLRPGLLSRGEALVQRGNLAVRLILGCVPLLVLAGLIEGLLSPSSLPWQIKLGVGLCSGIALHTYWLAAGRSDRTRSSTSLRS